MIRILITDDHPMVREGLIKILKDEPDVKVVGEAQNASEAMDRLKQQEVDVMILDISLPGRSGLDVLKDLKQRYPKLRILILSMHPEDRFARRVLKIGAAGYVTKESAPNELVKAIRKVYGGGTYVSPTLAEELAMGLQLNVDQPPHQRLSDREYEVMCMIASGKKTQEIALELSLSSRTVN